MTRSFPRAPIDTVTYGCGAFDGVGDQVEKLGGSRVFVVLSGSLAGSPVEERMRERLGSRLVGIYSRTRQHVPRSSVLEAAGLVRDGQADCLVSLGGGTPIDCARDTLFRPCRSRRRQAQVRAAQVRGWASA